VNLILRMLMVILRASRGRRLGVLDTSVLPMHVWPNDLDVQMHMNNGRYLSLMDLGRIDLMVRAGFHREAQKRGWFPVVGTAAINYKRSLSVFEKFELKTRLLSWDDRWFLIEQQFVRDGKVAATATIKAMMRSKEGLVSPQEALAVIGHNGASPTHTM
jgi:YbgC/YbaW family acyl-CoA thioester hydrolase